MEKHRIGLICYSQGSNYLSKQKKKKKEIEPPQLTLYFIQFEMVIYTQGERHIIWRENCGMQKEPLKFLKFTGENLCNTCLPLKKKKKKAVALIPATGSNSKLDEAREKEKYSSFMTSNNNVPWRSTFIHCFKLKCIFKKNEPKKQQLRWLLREI